MRRGLFIVVMLFLLTAFGASGFRLLTRHSWIDCIYLAVITLTTVGSREPDPLDTAGKLFVIAYLVCGLGIFTYSAFSLGQWVLSVRVQWLTERRRMEKAISKLSGHIVICGMGRMGRTICNYLDERGQDFVVVDLDDEATIPYCEERGWLYVIGDATDDQALLKAGTRRARALASVLATDADNVYVVLSAHMLNPELQISARASEEKAIEKMERAGATRVVSPWSTGAVKMARFMLTPSIEDFLEIADTSGNDLELADVQIGKEYPFVGKTLMDTDLREQGVMVIGIRRANGERLMPPPGSAQIREGDSLFVFGSADAVNAMIGLSTEA